MCDDYTHCKLGDFGLALKEESRSSASVVDHAAVGTLVYSPPEVIRGDRYGCTLVLNFGFKRIQFSLLEN